MMPAVEPRESREGARMLVLAADGTLADDHVDNLAAHLRPGDLVVLNDAATLPASLSGHTEAGDVVEVRLASQLDDTRWQVVLFGAGDWRTPTEHRPPAPHARVGSTLRFAREGVDVALDAVIEAGSAISPRLVTLRFLAATETLWSALYALGVPIQYAHLRSALRLWSVQTAFAGRPWAVELPSAGRPLSSRTLAALRAGDIEIALVTHAAGLSATGDPLIDRALPLPERFEVPASTLWRIADTKRAGGRVIAIGTSVVRALEASADAAGASLPIVRTGMATLRIDTGRRLRVVDGLLTGMHVPGESHYDLLGAFRDAEQLERAAAHANRAGYLCHEFGDTTLIMPAPAPDLRVRSDNGARVHRAHLPRPSI